MNVFFGNVLRMVLEYTTKCALEGCEDIRYLQHLKPDTEILGQLSRIIDRAFRRIRPRHADADHVLGADCIRRNGGCQRRINSSAQADNSLTESAFTHVVARSQHQSPVYAGLLAFVLRTHIARERIGVEED